MVLPILPTGVGRRLRAPACAWARGCRLLANGRWWACAPSARPWEARGQRGRARKWPAGWS